MIKDFVLALLSAPLTDADGFATERRALWTENLRRWLVRAAEQDRSLEYEPPAWGAEDRRFRLVIRRPVPATVDFVPVTATDLAAEPPAATGCDLVVVLLCLPAAPPESALHDWLDGLGLTRHGQIVLEPRWAAAVLVELSLPLFWGFSAREENRSLLDSMVSPC